MRDGTRLEIPFGEDQESKRCDRRLLGLTNISTTQRYMHLDDGELADAQDLVE